MIACFPRPFSRKAAAFSLVELFASIAVLSLLLMMFSKMVDITANTWRSGTQRAEISTEARVLLGLLERDLQGLVFRSDLPVFTGTSGRLLEEEGDQVHFFYTTLGSPGGNRKLSLVQYRLDSAKHQLIRSDLGFNYLSAPADSPQFRPINYLTDLGTPTPQAIAEGIVDFRWQFLDGKGNLSAPNSQTPFSYDHSDPALDTNSRAVSVSLLALNSDAMKFVRQNPDALETLKSKFGVPGVNETWADQWNEDLDSTGFASGLPAPVRTGVYIYHRRFILPVASVR